MTLSFNQIVYNHGHELECYPFANICFNDSVTEYFENSVISYLVPTITDDYIAVCSWRLKEKRQSGSCPMILGIYGNDDLSEEKILHSESDVINLRPFSQGHKMLANAALWHGGQQHNFAWENAIEELRSFIDIPEEVKTPIYENAFVAKRDIYHEYVSGCLTPVMDFMRNKPVFFADSGYAEKKRRADPKALQEYLASSGREDYPIAPFILERLFSIWINNRPLKIVNL